MGNLRRPLRSVRDEPASGTARKAEIMPLSAAAPPFPGDPLKGKYPSFLISLAANSPSRLRLTIVR